MNLKCDPKKAEKYRLKYKLKAIGELLLQMEVEKTIREHLISLDEKLDRGFDWLKPSGRYSRPRIYELASALNHLRCPKVKH